MTQEEMMDLYRKEAIRSQVLKTESSGVSCLFESACLDNNGKMADELREKMHELLDAQLDALASTQVLFRQALLNRE